MPSSLIIGSIFGSAGFISDLTSGSFTSGFTISVPGFSIGLASSGFSVTFARSLTSDGFFGTRSLNKILKSSFAALFPTSLAIVLAKAVTTLSFSGF